MRILITGDKGFIGQHLRRELDNAGHETYGADLQAGIDLRDPRMIGRILDASEAQVCVHLAAKIGRLFGEDNPLETATDNAGITALVAQACGERGVRLVYASTSEVYGDCGEDLCTEDLGAVWLPSEDENEEVNGQVGVGWSEPHNIYGLSKRWGEEVCRLYAPDELTIWRISMPYGPGLPAGRGRAAIVNMLDQAWRRVKIPVHRGAERSWCWIGDTTRAMLLTIERTQGGVFNIGRDDRPLPMFGVAEFACEITGAPLDLIEEINPPARQTVVKRLDTSKIRALGWEPEVELFDGMALTFTSMLKAPVAA